MKIINLNKVLIHLSLGYNGNKTYKKMFRFEKISKYINDFLKYKRSDIDIPEREREATKLLK